MNSIRRIALDAVEYSSMQETGTIRTLHILPELKEGGLERGVVDKVIWLKKHGVDSIVVSVGGIWVKKLEDSGIRHIGLPTHRKNPFTILRCSAKLSKIIADEKIRLVCAHSRVPAWIAHLATRHGDKHNPPLVIEAQALYEPFWYSKVMCRGDRVIAVSGVIRDHMISLGCDASRIRIVPRWFSPESVQTPPESETHKLRSEWGVPKGSPLIVGVGRITRIKGWDILIEALNKIRDRELFCVIVGSAHRGKMKYFSELKNQVDKLGLSERIRFVGHRDDMDLVYAAADCVVLPSRIVEAFGRVVLEGLIAGKAVISTVGCGGAEFFGDEYKDFMVPMNDPATLAGKIMKVISDPDGTKEKVSSIRERILKGLSLDRAMWSTVSVYRELLPDLPWPVESQS
jgi:glycosyltransferase involved in cell wall biosynthesis